MTSVILTPVTAVILEFIFWFLSSIFVVLRIWVRLCRNGLFSASDYMVVATWLGFLSTACFDTVMVGEGFKNPRLTLALEGDGSAFVLLPHGKLKALLKMLLASSVPYYFSLWGVKFTLLFLYYDIFPPSVMPRKFRLALHTLAFYLVTSFIVVICMNIFWCQPMSSNWDVDNPQHACFTYFAYPPYLAAIVLHITSEIFVYTLPLPVFHLRLSKEYFWSAVAMFVIGFIGVLVTICRVVVIFTVHDQPVIGIFQALAALEQLVGLVVVCLPPLKSFILRNTPRNSLVMTLGRLTSNLETSNGKNITVDEGDHHGNEKVCGNGFITAAEADQHELSV